jgi:glycosyltransferase involved in cell wall biosynthesis
MILRRLVFEVWYTVYVLWRLWRRPAQVDLLIAVFPPSLFFCLAPLMIPSATRRVGIVHDFQAALGLAGTSVLKRQLQRLVRVVEKRSFQWCQTLIVLSNSMARRAIREYGEARERLAVAYPFVTLKSSSTAGTALRHLFPEEFQHVVYSGALGKKQNPFELLRFFRAATSHFSDVQFHICSEGPIFEELRRMHGSDPVDRVIFHGLVAESDLEELYLRSDIQVIPQEEGSGDSCLPSKLPNILASGGVVFAICEADSELANILHRCSGIAVASWEFGQLIDKLRNALELTKTQTRSDRQALATPLLAGQFSLDSLVNVILKGPHSEVEAGTCIVRLESQAVVGVEIQ